MKIESPQNMTSRETIQFFATLLLPVACAVIGFLLGRLIRGRPPAIEVARPRIAISIAYCRDAHDKSLSPHRRVLCAFESVYFCFLEIAAESDVNLSEVTHPSADVVETGLTAMRASANDQQTVEVLVAWASNMSPLLPEVSLAEACSLAKRMHTATVSLLS
jgi:hypothetical protein